MTPKQAECLEAIKRLTADNISPSIQELMDELGVTSKSTVAFRLRRLREMGAITFEDRRARSIRVCDDTPPPYVPTSEYAQAYPYAPKVLATIPSPRLGEIRDSIEAILANRFADATGGNVTRFPPQLRTVKS